MAANGAYSEWMSHTHKTLNWGRHLLPFSDFLAGDHAFQHAVLALLLELPHTEESARILAQHFHDPDSLDPEVQEKLQWILKEWQRVFIEKEPVPNKDDSSDSSETSGYGGMSSPRGKTLSVLYHRLIPKVERMVNKKAKTFGEYKDQVYSNPDQSAKQEHGLHVGSRHMESTEEYLQFLDLFYAVSFSKALDEIRDRGSGSKSLPLLTRFSGALRSQELESLHHKAVTSLQRKQSSNSSIWIQNPNASIPRPSTPPDNSRVLRREVQVAKSPSRHSRGLFRSSSLGELNDGMDQGNPGKSGHRKKGVSRSASYEDLLGGVGNKPRIRRQAGKSGSKSDVSLPPQSPRDKVVSPRNRTSGKLDRSYSASDLQDLVDEVEEAKEIKPQKNDPLTAPVMPGWKLDSLEFGKDYDSLDQLLEWLSRWAGRNHSLLLGQHGPGSTTPAQKIHIPPKLILYSLWLLENCYNPPPSVVPAVIPKRPQEIIVGTAMTDGPDYSRRDEPGASTNPGNEEMTGTSSTHPTRGKGKKGKKASGSGAEKRLQRGKTFQDTLDSDSLENVPPGGVDRLQDGHSSDRSRGKKTKGREKTKKPGRAGNEKLNGEPENARTGPVASSSKDGRKLAFRLPQESPEPTPRDRYELKVELHV